jgi:hypothetical protein
MRTFKDLTSNAALIEEYDVVPYEGQLNANKALAWVRPSGAPGRRRCCRASQGHCAPALPCALGTLKRLSRVDYLGARIGSRPGRSGDRALRGTAPQCAKRSASG